MYCDGLDDWVYRSNYITDWNSCDMFTISAMIAPREDGRYQVLWQFFLKNELDMRLGPIQGSTIVESNILGQFLWPGLGIGH